MSNNEQSRIEQLEALASEILKGLAETRQVTNSNAKSIEALTNALNQEREERINALNHEREEWIRKESLYQQTITDMQRQFIDIGRRTDNNSADIRELIIENQRILRYLESIVNKTGNNS